jgi:hypothetical protein
MSAFFLTEEIIPPAPPIGVLFIYGPAYVIPTCIYFTLYMPYFLCFSFHPIKIIIII